MFTCDELRYSAFLGACQQQLHLIPAGIRSFTRPPKGDLRKPLQKTYSKYRSVEFPSLRKQLDVNFDARIRSREP